MHLTATEAACRVLMMKVVVQAHSWVCQGSDRLLPSHGYFSTQLFCPMARFASFQCTNTQIHKTHAHTLLFCQQSNSLLVLCEYVSTCIHVHPPIHIQRYTFIHICTCVYAYLYCSQYCIQFKSKWTLCA